MKCEECLPLLEEYVDGEVDKRVAGQMDAHLAACAECAEALDALQAEQEMYLRYDRELEVSPAMWQAISERIAGIEPAREAKRVPLTSRLREQFVAAFAFLSLRPALASSMALVILGVAAGLLWLNQAPRPQNSDTIARRGEPVPIQRPTPGPDQRGVERPVETPAPGREPAETASTNQPVKVLNIAGTAVHGTNAAADGASDVVVLVPGVDHLKGDDEVLDSVLAPVSEDEDVVAINTRLLDPEQKEVARHVEQAQMLLRSFRNARYSEGEGPTNIAYEKSLSRKLLDENVSLQLEAESAGNKTTRQVLSSLEPFLLDISNLRDEPSRDEVRSIKERMQKKEIIASLEVY